MRKIIYIAFFFGFSSICFAKPAKEVGFGFGMAMVSYQEEQNSLEGENVAEPASASFSSIAANLYWKFAHYDSFSLYLGGAFPLTEADGHTFFSAGIGIEYYLSETNQRIRERSQEFSLYMDPALRYYLLGEINGMYFTYLTERAKMNDINVELALGGGVSYSFGGALNDWGLRASATVGRGMGSINSTFNIKSFVSLIYYID